LRHTSFARIRPETVAAAQPSVGDEDFNTLIDKFCIQTTLSSDDFRAQLCRVLDATLTLHNAEEFLVLIVESLRDELRRRAAPTTP
jgi:hypothetical protein